MAGSPDRCSGTAANAANAFPKGPYPILVCEKLWKGERLKQSMTLHEGVRPCGRREAPATEFLGALRGTLKRVAHWQGRRFKKPAVLVQVGVYDGPRGSDRSLEGAQERLT